MMKILGQREETCNYRRLLPNKHRRQSYCNPIASIQVAKSMNSRRRNRKIVYIEKFFDTFTCDGFTDDYPLTKAI